MLETSPPSGEAVSGLHEQDMTTRYDLAEHLRTSEEMAAYFKACLDEADGDAAFIGKALGDIARAKRTRLALARYAPAPTEAAPPTAVWRR